MLIPQQRIPVRLLVHITCSLNVCYTRTGIIQITKVKMLCYEPWLRLIIKSALIKHDFTQTDTFMVQRAADGAYSPAIHYGGAIAP